jgi:hypothetical protein
MAKYTRQTYQMTADILSAHIKGGSLAPYTIKCIAEDFARKFEEDNDRFNYSKFMTACGFH